ncbi:hypothetical protein Adeh_2605 [Anaeromyxobacter dehalogenans 2CP-C]|uniref:Uncharacterized protein n=1 Tax=Anaeromyxobacter dehalogenans (strain 2CP-C) TaxID=290397 RepID=Q2IL46_ANADE|nr:hypothetical protein Adeh_2605 [Anaeromyxobacter dehalogenans 2CP-C]
MTRGSRYLHRLRFPVNPASSTFSRRFPRVEGALLLPLHREPVKSSASCLAALRWGDLLAFTLGPVKRETRNLAATSRPLVRRGASSTLAPCGRQPESVGPPIGGERRAR